MLSIRTGSVRYVFVDAQDKLDLGRATPDPLSGDLEASEVVPTRKKRNSHGRALSSSSLSFSRPSTPPVGSSSPLGGADTPTRSVASPALIRTDTAPTLLGASTHDDDDEKAPLLRPAAVRTTSSAAAVEPATPKPPVANAAHGPAPPLGSISGGGDTHPVHDDDYEEGDEWWEDEEVRRGVPSGRQRHWTRAAGCGSTNGGRVLGGRSSSASRTQRG